MVIQDPRVSLSSHQVVRLKCGHRPERAQYLIETIYALCVEALCEPLQQCFDNFEQQLLAMAETAHSSAGRESHLACRKQVLSQHEAFEQRFIDQLTNEFNTFDALTAAPVLTSNARGWYALKQLVARGEIQHGRALHDLAYRVAVLVAAPPLEGGALPFGPRALAHAFQHASMELDLPTERHVLWLSNFSQAVIQLLAPLYDTINQQLQAAGILPQLSAVSALDHRQPRHDDNTAAKAAVSSTNFDNDPPVSSRVTTDALESIRTLLMQQGGHFGPALDQGGARVASADEIQYALMMLQASPAYIDNPRGREIRSADQLREDLLIKLNAGRSDGELPIQLDDQQNNALELIELLFVQLGQQLSHSSAARALMHRLQLPILRMAIADPGFFHQPDHPAQKLLGTVAAATSEWLIDGDDGDEGDHGAKRPLATNLEQIVDRAWREPASAQLYADLLTAIEPHLSLLTSKAKASERHHVEASQFQERMALAQQRAAELLAERFAQFPTQKLTRILLVRIWTDALALTLLRHGESSDSFRKQLVVTDQLLGRVPIGDPSELRQEVEAGLRRIGLSAAESADVTEQLCEGCSHHRIIGLPSTFDAATNAESHMRPARPAGATLTLVDLPVELPAAMDATSNIVASDLEQRIEQRLRTLPFGSWLEVLDPTSDAPARRKLAWYSHISGRCLLVSRRGQHGTQTTLAQLAREIAAGRMREVPEQPGNLLDQAWRNLANMLRVQSNASESADSEIHS